MTAKVRFAPSPTGRLHVGNVRIALVNWLFARQKNGRFLLRLDDTDAERSTQVYADAIEDDLDWLGLVWDDFARQSDRLHRYREVEAELRAAGRLYPCYESAEELALKRKAQLARGKPPVYDRAALALDEAARDKLEAAGRRPHWRFRLDASPIEWHDLVRGEVRFAGENLSDPVLVREDGHPLYTLSSVVDDADLGITHVIRGEDHVANTAVQVQLFQALGATVPGFGHLSLMTDAEGAGLSKRLGSMSIAGLREGGLEAMAINSLLARLGTPDPVAAAQTLAELLDGFDLARFGRAAPKFDAAELAHVNARLLHEMPYARAWKRLAEIGIDGADEAFWLVVRENLDRLDEAKTWWQVCRGPVEPVIEEAAFCREAAALLPPEPWDGATWGAWTGAVKQATGRKGKALFMPLRLALTGLGHGPALHNLLPLIGHDRAAARLSGKTA